MSYMTVTIGRYCYFLQVLIIVQLQEAMHPVIRYVQDAFVIELDTENYTISTKNVFVLVYSPSLAQNRYVLTRFTPKLVDDGKKIQATLGFFKTSGYELVYS